MKRTALLGLLVLAASQVIASDNHDALAKAILAQIGFPRFCHDEARSLVADLKRKHPGVPEEYFDQIGREVVSYDYMTPLAALVRGRSTEDESQQILDYLRSSAGVKDLAKMRELRRGMRDPKFNMEAYSASYFEPYTMEEAVASKAFRKSEVGSRFWTTVPDVYTLSLEEFAKASRQALDKVLGPSAGEKK
jgi:hypothetical protein